MSDLEFDLEVEMGAENLKKRKAMTDLQKQENEEMLRTPSAKRRRRASTGSSSTLSSADSEELPLSTILTGTASRDANGQQQPYQRSTKGHKGEKTASRIDSSSKKSVGSKGPGHASKTLGSSRTVPDHQPGTPHADLHNDAEEMGLDGQLLSKPMDDEELRDAVAIRVKLEEGVDEGALSPSKKFEQRPVEQLVLGQAVDDEELAHEASSIFHLSYSHPYPYTYITSQNLVKGRHSSKKD